MGYREGTPSRTHHLYKQRTSDGRAISDYDSVVDSSRRAGNYSLKECKIEEDELDSDETTFAVFASLLDSACHGAFTYSPSSSDFSIHCILCEICHLSC